MASDTGIPLALAHPPLTRTRGISNDQRLPPLAEEYHFVLFIPLIFALAAKLAPSSQPREWNGFKTLIPVLAVLVMAAPVNYKVLQNSSFPVVLLAYPKLYAGLALLIYTCGVMKRREPEGADVPRRTSHTAQGCP